MKILSLSFKNINSLKGEHEIDFTDEHFSQNPLFAITGPTGSGKTTILDVISLALFNEVPRIGKISNSDIEQKGAILTRNQKEAYAEVRYECSHGKFVSIWSISTNRNNKLRPYEMELSQLEPHQTLDLKKSEVPAENEKLIGLSYSQFIKSVVLAQGEFAKFLKANKKERSQLLEQITGTGIYRELGIKAYRKYKDESIAIEQDIKILEAEKEELLSEDERVEMKVKVQESQIRIAKTEKQLERAKTQLRLQTDLQNLASTLVNKKSNLTKEENHQKAFLEENGKAMQNHETVQGFSAELQSWEHKNEQLQNRKQEKEKLLQQQKCQVEVQAEKLGEIQGFINKKIEPKNTEKDLHEFYVKVDALQQKRNELQGEYKEKEGLFRREIEDLNLKFSTLELIKNESKWLKVREQNQQERQILSQNFQEEIPDDFEAVIKKYEEELGLTRNAKNDQRYILKLKQDVTAFEKRIADVKTQLKPLPEQIKTSAHNAELQQEHLKRLRLEQENHLMQAKLEDYRNKLKHGEACPLCGAKEHPFAEEKPQEKSGLVEQITAKEKELNTSQNEFSKLKTRQEELTKQLANQQTELKKKTEERDAQRQKFSSDFGEKFSEDESNWEDKIQTKENEIKQLEKLYELHKKQNLIKRANPIFQELQEIIKTGSTLKTTIEKHYRGSDLLKDVQNHQNSWQNLKQKLEFTKEQLTEATQKLETETTNFSTLENELLPKLKAKDFQSIQDAKKALLPAEKFKQFKEQVQEFREVITELKSALNTLEHQHKKLKETLETNLNTEALKTEKENVEKALKQIQDANNEHLRILKNNAERLKKTEARQQKIKAQQQKNRRWKMLNELIGSATGDKFNQFAQDLTLRHLLTLANQRLKDLSERYRLDTSEENTDNLVVADLDMGGQRRSVKTLSGGETFLLSLSLALALSDLASKNISINSLFIDEGFGTLDPETLDQTLDTLERLQANSTKTIGIISHVESLKERIGTQIQLQRDGRGYSSLKIVSK